MKPENTHTHAVTPPSPPPPPAHLCCCYPEASLSPPPSPLYTPVSGVFTRVHLGEESGSSEGAPAQRVRKGRERSSEKREKRAAVKKRREAEKRRGSSITPRKRFRRATPPPPPQALQRLQRLLQQVRSDAKPACLPASLSAPTWDGGHARIHTHLHLTSSTAALLSPYISSAQEGKGGTHLLSESQAAGLRNRSSGHKVCVQIIICASVRPAAPQETIKKNGITVVLTVFVSRNRHSRHVSFC